MTDTLYHERQFSTDYLFSLNHYYNQRSSRLPLAGQHNHMEDFTPLAQRCSQSLEKKMFLGRKVNMWQRFIFPHEFQSKDLEKLFQMYAYPFCFDGLRCLLILMIALTVSLSIVNFVFVSRLSLENIANSSLCLSFVVILICLHTRFMTQRLVSIVTILIVMLCLVFCAVSFAVDEQTLSPGFDHKINLRRIMSGGFTFSRVEAVWRLCYVTFILYAFVPLKFYLPVVFGLFVALLHSLLAVFLPSYQPNTSPVLSKQVIANLFLFLMVNVVCAYLYRAREKEMRSAFNQIRSSTALQLQLQDENDKADKLLASMIPASIALEMKGDLQTPHLRDFFQKVYMEKHENVSILFADLMGLSILSSQCSALELIRFLNEAVGRFDQLAAENHCQRIQLQGDRYFCASGVLDQRPDHAKCCVEMGIDLIDFMSFVANLTAVNLRMRVGVHSGQVTCGVVGVSRWQYDVWSEDVELAGLTEKAGQPGKVLVTSATLDHLQEEFPVVANRNNCSKLEARGVKTFFVITEHPRKHYFLPKSASNSCTKNIGGVLSAIKFNVEQPLSNIVSRTMNFVSSNNSFEDADVIITSKSKKSSSFSERHRKHLIQLIANKSVKKKKTEHVNYLGLSFKSSALERSFQTLEDVQFASKLFIALVLLVISMIIHALILPRTIFLLVFFLVCFAWISVVLMLVLGYRIRCIGCDVKKSFLARRSIILVSILLHFVMSFLNTLCCRGGIVFPDRMVSPSESVVSFHHPSHLECLSPQYIYLNALPCFFLVFLFARLSVSAKLGIWLLMSVGYLMIMEFANRTFFFNYDSKLGSEIPSDAPGILMLLHFVIALYLCSRDLDWLLRLGHVWHDQVRKQRLEVSTMENLNQDLFHNLLPDHVVPYFDNVPENKIIDFYSHSYSRVTVMQVSVTNMSQVHGDLVKRSRTSESLRVLHEIISAFDKGSPKGCTPTVPSVGCLFPWNDSRPNLTKIIVILKVHMDPRFMSTVKIKSSGPSYLVIGGLKPSNKIDDSKENKKLHLNIIMELALKMREALLPISRGRLTFRAGIDFGPAIAGVIGARKPQYEIIGDTVNTACLLNSTSLPNCIQVSHTVYEVLQACYEFKCRGTTKLKNSREQLTYFLSGANPPKPASFFDFEKDEEFVPCSRYNICQDKFTELPAFDHSIKRPQPITPQTPSKAHSSCQMFNFSSINNPGYFHHHNDSLSAFSTSIQPSGKSTDLHWNQCNQLEFQNLNQSKKISGTSDSRAHFVSNSQNHQKNTAFPSIHGPLKHTSAFIPAGAFNANTIQTGNGKALLRMANIEDFNESHVNKKPNDGNNNSYPDHMHPCNPNCSQSYAISAGTGATDCQSQLCSQTSSEKIDENAGASDFWRNESDFCERKPSNKDREIEADKKVTPKNSIRLSTSDVEDIEAIMKEIGANQNKKSDLYLSEEQDHSKQEVNASEILSSDQKESADEGGLMHLENGIIYTKKFVDDSLLKNSGQMAGSNQPGASLYANVPKMRSSGKKVQERDKPNTKLLIGANGFLEASGPLVQNLPKSAFIVVRNNINNVGLKSQPIQNSRAPLQNGTHASLAKTLLAANLTSKLRLHQQSLKNSEPTKQSQQHESTNSRHSMAVPPQNLRDRWGHTDSPTRSKSLDRIAVEVSDELNSSSSLGESSPKMLQRTSNKRDIASLCANGSSVGENQKQPGSGLFQVKHLQKSKVRNNPMHLTLAADRLSLSSFNSEMSRSDPALSYESSSAIESEYDNYRPGMASDEDYFAVEPVSDVEIDIFDEANVENVKVDEDYENYNFDSLMSSQSNRMTAEL